MGAIEYCCTKHRLGDKGAVEVIAALIVECASSRGTWISESIDASLYEVPVASK